MNGDGDLLLKAVRVAFNAGTPDERMALDGVDLRLRPGEYATIIGPNGAGKSTLLNTIAGTVMPSAGSIELNGTPITRLPEHRRSHWLARVMQDPQANTSADLTIGENLAFAERRGHRRSPLRRGRNAGRLERSVEMLRLHSRGLDRRLGDSAGDLSGGQRQLLAMVMAISQSPDVLLLDEHTSALDPEMADVVQRLTDDAVAATSMRTLMITHNMKHALAHGNRLLIMSNGRIVDDIAGREKAEMTEDALIKRFRSVVKESVSDRLLG